MEKAKKFFEEILKTDEAKELLASIEKPETEEACVEAYLEIAKKLGVELTAEGIRSYFSGDVACSELDDEELSQLTGGQGSGFSKCEYSFLQRENCWVNDACDEFFYIYDTYRCKYSVV